MINITKRINLKSLLLLIPAFALLLLFILPMFWRITNHGNQFGAIFCAGVILLWGFFPLLNRHKATRAAVRVILVLIAAGLAWAVFLSANMLAAMTRTPPDGDYTVIVLGCHVWHGVPSTMLEQRLITARDYLHENETLMCVTTGGYGAGQSVSEARTGKNWLERHGVDESRLFLEDASTSTWENLTYAREVIAEEGLPPNIVIVSDGFHLWRARIMAERLFDDGGGDSSGAEIYVIPAPTRPATLLPTYWVREWLALTYYFAAG
jgi:uncharacterized SAM-binding protein YcdF (DUF218 family)